MLAFSEIGTDLLDASDNGYDVLVGSTAARPCLFHGYATHPNVLNHALNSTAAGRYQIIHPTFVGLCKQHGYKDFTPTTQDAMALDLIAERGALDAIETGDLSTAVTLCSKEWASLPGSTSGQHENKFAALQKAYTDAGGTIKDSPDAQILS